MMWSRNRNISRLGSPEGTDAKALGRHGASALRLEWESR